MSTIKLAPAFALTESAKALATPFIEILIKNKEGLFEEDRDACLNVEVLLEALLNKRA